MIMAVIQFLDSNGHYDYIGLVGQSLSVSHW